MVTAHPSAFGSLLKRYRLAAGLTQEELAERARLSARAVSDLERGVRRAPYRDTVQQLADALELGDEERAGIAAAARRAPGSEELAPAEPATSSPPNNLSSESTSFIGREKEIAAISALLAEPTVRLVTLTGPGGIGKTRLALHLAARLHDRHPDGAVGYPDGVFFVSLASIGEPGLVPSAIAGVLNVKETGGQSLIDALIEHLRARRLLLVMDNFEHLVDARSLLGELLEACPSLSLLVTSRMVLHLSWEHAFEVPPLGLPGLTPGAERAAPFESEAVALFVERARAVRADFALTRENGEAVAQICRTLDGMPLAIELAAARLRLFPPQALLGRLSQRLQFLTGGAHDLPARHQTLRGTIDWSYSLLDEEEKQLFTKLSVFRGGCTLEAVEAVCNSAGDLGAEVLDGVASLVEKSLLRQDSSRVPALEGDPRFVMLETIREYASERLEEKGASEGLRKKHIQHYLILAEEAARGLEGAEQGVWLERLEVERDNLRAALQWARSQGDLDHALRLALALSGFWMMRGPLSEGRRRFDELIAAKGGTPAFRAAALSAGGRLAMVEGRHHDSADLFERSLALHQELGDREGSTEAMSRLAHSWYMAGEVERAEDLLRRTEMEGRESGDQMMLAWSLGFQAHFAAMHGDEEKAQKLGEESLMLYRELGDNVGIAEMLQVLPRAAYGTGDRTQARALIDSLLDLLHQSPLDPEKGDWVEVLGYVSRIFGDFEYATYILEDLAERAAAVGNRRILAHAWGGLGLLARERGDYRRAVALYEKGLPVLQDVGDLLGYCRLLVGLSDVARDQGDAERVIELCEESLPLLQESGDLVLKGYALHNLGLAAWYQGDRSRAERLIAESLSLFQKLRSAEVSAEALASTGLLALDGGQYDWACEIFSECLVTARESVRHLNVALLLWGMAGVNAGTGQAERAARLFGAAEALHLAIGTPRWPALQPLYDRSVAAARAALGEEMFLHALKEGREMTLEQATSYALHEDMVS